MSKWSKHSKVRLPFLVGFDVSQPGSDLAVLGAIIDFIHSNVTIGDGHTGGPPELFSSQKSEESCCAAERPFHSRSGIKIKIEDVVTSSSTEVGELSSYHLARCVVS